MGRTIRIADVYEIIIQCCSKVSILQAALDQLIKGLLIWADGVRTVSGLTNGHSAGEITETTGKFYAQGT